MTNRTFGGLCVLALESRRAREIAKLITNLGGVAIVAPSVREVPLESNQEAVQFARSLASGQVDMESFLVVSVSDAQSNASSPVSFLDPRRILRPETFFQFFAQFLRKSGALACS